MPRPKAGRQGLTLTTRKGRPGFYIRGTVRGTSVFESAGTGDRTLAEEARAAREADLYRAAIHGPRPEAKAAVTFAVAAHSYLTTQERSSSTRARVARITGHFGMHMACEAIKQTEIDAACAALCRESAQPATKLREVVAPIRAVLMHAARRGWCAVPMFERMKAAKKRTDWLTPGEAQAMVDAASNVFRPMLEFLFCTGCRVNEAIGLEWSEVDLQHARAVIRGARDPDGLRGTKNGRDRILDLPARAVDALANLPGRAGRVFLDRHRRPYRDTNDSKTVAYGGQIKNAWRAALKGAGIVRQVTPHHARHSYATWHYAVHKDLMRLRQDGDWSSVAQVERYAKLAPAGMAEDVLAFWRFGRKLVAVDKGNARESA